MQTSHVLESPQFTLSNSPSKPEFHVRRVIRRKFTSMQRFNERKYAFKAPSPAKPPRESLREAGAALIESDKLEQSQEPASVRMIRDRGLIVHVFSSFRHGFRRVLRNYRLSKQNRQQSNKRVQPRQ
jgi:hypothetical protein